MFQRTAKDQLVTLACHFPVVAVTGPRQSGKTTLVREVFPDLPYANLEAPDVRARAIEDPRGFLSQYPDGVIIDEIQRAPDLFSYLQVLVDESQIPGRYIITGSHQFSLHSGISQSLAGRVALLTLLPFSTHEIAQKGTKHTLYELMFKGGYPKIYADPMLNPTILYRNYYQTYLERDVRELIAVKNLSIFQKFIRLVAGRVGQLLNFASLANDVGVSVPTIREWISILEASYVLITLKPYYENFGKRVTKSPKVYFSDTGLLCYLLGIAEPAQVMRDPLVGNIFENFVFLELMKERTNKGVDPNIYFFRDQSGREVDFILEAQRTLTPIEVKVAETYTPTFQKGIVSFYEIAAERAKKGFVVYGGTESFSSGPVDVVSYRDMRKSIYE